MATKTKRLVRTSFGAVIETFTVDQYHEMMRTGILLEGSPIELIDGVVVRKDRGDSGNDQMAGPRHSSAVRKLNSLFNSAKIEGAFHQTQQAVQLGEDEEPEPDVSVILGSEDDFSNRHPGPQEIVAVIEVADSSLRYDRTVKQAIYASAGIPVYWIVNLVNDTLEVYSEPLADEDRYKNRIVHRGATASLELPSGQVIGFPLVEIFPPVSAS